MEGDKTTGEHRASTLAEFLRVRREEILDEWQAAARSIPRARDLSEAELLDHFPRLLDRIIDMVGDLSEGREPAPPRGDAEQHAARRLSEGFDLVEIVREYTALRESILQLWHPLHGRSRETIVLHGAIDRAIAASVDRYTEARNRTLQALDRVASAALAAPDLEGLLDRLLRVFVETTLVVDTSSILLREGDRVYTRASVGLEEDVAREFSLALGEGFAGKIAQELKPRETHCAADDPEVKSAALRRRGVRALYGVPLLGGGELIGVAHMGSCSSQEFSEEDKRLFRVMAVRASAAIQLQRLRDEENARSRDLKRLEQLISAHPDLFYLLDREHRFSYVSPSLLQLWQRRADEVLGKTFEEIGYSAKLVQKHREQLQRALRGETVRGDNPYRSDSGHLAHYEYIFTPVVGPSGHIDAVAGVTRDVTERMLHEAELQSTIEFRERLIGILGHDLRSPLSSVTMGVQLLLRREDLPEAYYRPLTRIANSADRMSRMIRDIVDFARSRHGTPLPIVPVPADLARICQEALDELKLMYEDERLQLEASGDCQGCWDRDRLTQVVANLAANAIKHSTDRHPVTVRIRGETDTATLEVHNCGPPIPLEESRRIFEPFHTTSEAAEGGLGLGLYIVREIVAAHGGSIDVRSTQKEGTQFRVVLPKEVPH